MEDIHNLEILSKIFSKHSYSPNLNIPNQLFCKRHSTNELLVVTQWSASPTSLSLTIIDLTLTQQPIDSKTNSKDFYSTKPIIYQTMEEEEKQQKDFKLEHTYIPTKIFMNQRENIMLIMGQHWVGVIALDNDVSLLSHQFKPELQVVGCRSDPKNIDITEYFLDVKFHPLSPYTLCLLNDRNNFRMFDLTSSIDNAFIDLTLSPSPSDGGHGEGGKNWGFPSMKNSKITGFDFGSRSALGWQMLTWYFITAAGEVYYLTPLIPLKFGIDKVFFDKLLEKGVKSHSALSLLNYLNDKKQFISNDSSTIIVILNEEEILGFVPELQGPVNNPLLDNHSKNGFEGILALNTYPQVFISYNIKSQAFIQVSFEEPTPLFENETRESCINWVVKEGINLAISEDTKSDFVQYFQKDPLDPFTIYHLRGKFFTKIWFPWLSDIYRQLKSTNFSSNEFDYNPQRSTETKILYEFISPESGCTGIASLYNSLYIMRALKTDNGKHEVSFKILAFSEGDYTDIQDKVDDILHKRPDIEEVVKESVSKVEQARYDSFKLPSFDPVRLQGKKEKLNQKEFLKRFTEEAKGFTENVVTEVQAFSKDMKSRNAHVGELQKLNHNKQSKLEANLEKIEKSQKDTLDLNSKILMNNSKITTKLESITEKLRNKVSAPLSEREEQLLLKIEEFHDRLNQMKKTIETQTDEFLSERKKEQEHMKNYDIKFSKDEIENQITPQAEKLLNIKEDLKRYREILR